MNVNDLRRLARDAAEEAVPKAMKSAVTEAARAQRLRTRLEHVVGTIPEEHQTSNQIGRYGLEKLQQELPESGNHADALEYFLAGRAGRGFDARRGGMDSTATIQSVLDKYISE